MATVTNRVASDNDDIIVWGSSYDLTPSGLYLGHDGTSNDFGLRFVLNVAAGATITAASLTFTANASLSNDTVRVKIYYQDANDPGNFSGDDAAAFGARTRSSVSVDWDFTTNWSDGTEYASADITSLIQALVNEAYWSSGEHCVILIEDDSSDNTAYRKADSYHSDSSAAALLSVTYAEGAAVAMGHFRRRRV